MEEKTRSEKIHDKGFSMNNNANNFNYTNIPENMNFNKIKVGAKNLEDAILDLGSIKKSLPNYPYGDKR